MADRTAAAARELVENMRSHAADPDAYEVAKFERWLDAVPPEDLVPVDPRLGLDGKLKDPDAEE